MATEHRREGIFLASDTAYRHPPDSGLRTDSLVQNVYNLAWKLALLARTDARAGLCLAKELFSDTLGAEERCIKLKEQVSLGNRRSNATGLHMGQRYTTSNAVVDDGTPFPPRQRDQVLNYEPTTHPGAYLPHAWVQHTERRISTLDILEHGHFGLIVGIAGKPWESVAAKGS
ncbi:hypothetical protein QQZ08_005848 [Neonectria magnoliae]|uniref:FAD-binding domain-containing protein n=1 Tax=Neonectria magnoliae TaxID=2732573 RepID=A0ABR1I219_9HYPO